MLLAADVGNSGIKVGAFEGDDLVATARMAPEDEDLAARLGVAPAAVEDLVVVSVSAPALARFLAGAGRGGLVLGEDLPIRIANRYERPEEVGRDRLADAAAAGAIANGAAVAVDLGSAVTVDAVGADGAFLGGPIAPGLPAFRAGLKAAAPALPEVPAGEPPAGIPRSTADALRTGAVLGLAGLVDRLVGETQTTMRSEGHAPDVPPVFLTGGDALLVAPWLSLRATVVPHLTLRGAARLYRRAREEDR